MVSLSLSEFPVLTYVSELRGEYVLYVCVCACTYVRGGVSERVSEGVSVRV